MDQPKNPDEDVSGNYVNREAYKIFYPEVDKTLEEDGILKYRNTIGGPNERFVT